MQLIADEMIVFESPYPKEVFCYTPSLCRGFGGRILAGFDLGGPGTTRLDGPRSNCGDSASGNQMRILLSDDDGASWRESSTRLPMLHAMLFRAGEALYALGHSGRLLISRSCDNGESWSEPAVLEGTHIWRDQGAGRIDFRNGKLYAVYEQGIPNAPWPGNSLVLMAAEEKSDLCDPANWRFSEPFRVEALFAEQGIRHVFPEDALGVLETSVIRIYDRDHLFYDPEDRTVLLLMRAEIGLGNVGAVLKGIESPDGSLRIEPLRTPNGGKLFLLPLPGGQLKFQLDYDPVSKLYWMIASPSVDGFRASGTPWDGSRSPARRRLELLCSRNGLEFRSVGVVAEGTGERDSRHYASLLFDGDDLLVFARSGDSRAQSLHNGNLLTLHRVKNFRAYA